MARLPALVDALAEHDRRGRPTIAHIARQVRDSGLITSVKRGAGAATMTFDDAATLLMAACGDSSPQGAVQAVNSLRSLRPAPQDQVKRMQREDLPDWFGFLREEASFPETVRLLIEHAPVIAQWNSRYEALAASESDKASNSDAEFSMRRAAALASPGALFQPGFAKNVRVVSYVPGVAAEVHLGRVWRQLEEHDAFHEYFVGPSPSAVSSNDCLVTVEVGLPTLMALHTAIVGPEADR